MPVGGAGSDGPPDLPPAEERIREAMLDLVTTQGYSATTVEELLERAHVGRATFKDLFGGKENCFLHVYDEATEDFTRCVFSAFEGEQEWRDGLRAAAYAAARWVRDHPRETRYGTVEMMTAGEFAQARRDVTLRRFVEMIDAGRQGLDDPDSVSPSIAEGVIGAIVGMLTKNIRRGTRMRPEDLVPELMFLAVRPYLGHEAALEEMTIPPPPEPCLEPTAKAA